MNLGNAGMTLQQTAHAGWWFTPEGGAGEAR